MQTIKAKNTEEYISCFPEGIQIKLNQIRNTIRKAAPNASEKISYAIPAFEQHGNLVHFAGYKNHIGFYPASSGIRKFQKELTPYKFSKGSVQFPLDKPLPLRLIARIVKFRIAENALKAKLKNQSAIKKRKINKK